MQFGDLLSHPAHPGGFVALAPMAFAQEDADGVIEHPMIERYPGQYIAWQNIQNYPTHFYPYTDTARTFYDPMGNSLLNGYKCFLLTYRHAIDRKL